MPQVGDEVVYFLEGHQSFFSMVPVKPEHVPLWELMAELPHDGRIPAVVEEVRFVANLRRSADVTLRILVDQVGEGGNTTALGALGVIRMRIDPGRVGTPEFLIPARQVEASDALRETALGVGSIVGVLFSDVQQVYFATVVSSSNVEDPVVAGGWESVVVRWKSDERVDRVNPWEAIPYGVLESVLGRVPRNAQAVDCSAEQYEMIQLGLWGNPMMDGTTRGRVVSALEAAMEDSTFVDQFGAFLEPVDTEMYPAYAGAVGAPSDLSTMLGRLRTGYYRTVDALRWDVRQLAEAAVSFNDEYSLITHFARTLSAAILACVDGASTSIDVDVDVLEAIPQPPQDDGGQSGGDDDDEDEEVVARGRRSKRRKVLESSSSFSGSDDDDDDDFGGGVEEDEDDGDESFEG